MARTLSLAALLLSAFLRPSQAFSPTQLLARRAMATRLNADRNGSNENKLIPMRPGSTVAVITPMKPTGEIDQEGLRNLLRYHIKSGTDNLCILGTTGEASVMTKDERALIWKIAVEECKGIIPILAGTGTINPASVKELMQQAADIGCDAALVVTPYYVKPPQRCLIQHFDTAANWNLLPVVVYNVPGRTGVNFLDENIAALAASNANVVALKDATGDLTRIEKMTKLLKENGRDKDFLLYSGDDATSVDFILKGGHGFISVTANVAAKAMADMADAALAGDEAKARAINEPLTGLHTKLFCESNPIPTKWAAKRIGLIGSGYARPPLAEMDPQFETVVEGALRQAGLLQPAKV